VSDLLGKLQGGDRRSIGRADEVVADVLNDPALFDDLFQGMLHDNPVVRMRSADAVEKITREHPEYLKPYKAQLIQHVAAIEQQEVRWHVAQILPRLDLSDKERSRVAEILMSYLHDESKIVKTMSMQALAELAEQDAGLLPQVMELLKELVETGSPAMRSRGRRLLEELRPSAPAARQSISERRG
jgi:hypothetical protein